MVTRFGMSDKVGPVTHHEEDLARLSPETKEAIDSEVRRLLQESRKRAETVLRTHKDELHRLAAALVDYETLTRDDIERVIKGVPLARARPTPAKKPSGDDAVAVPGVPAPVSVSAAPASPAGSPPATLYTKSAAPTASARPEAR